MKKDDKASVSLKKIIVISLIMIFVMGIGVMATNSKVSNVKIILSNGYEMKVLTSKTKVSEILDENHIILLPEEKTVPKSDEELSDNKTIKISKKDEEEQTIANQTGEVTIEEILQSYDSIVEKIIKEQITIPYETVTKDVSTGTGTKQDKVVQKGEDGIKEITYKAKYQNDVEIEKVEISSEVIKEPVNKIVEVRTNQVTSRASTERKATSNPAQTSTTSLAKKVEGITPTVKTLNASAYTASTCGKAPGSSGYGRTSSGAMASSWYTVAAGSGYKLGTVIYIPYFANKPMVVGLLYKIEVEQFLITE